jgi:DNA-binding response OmpR family regulator
MWHFGQILRRRQDSSIPGVSILCLLAEDPDRSLMTGLCRASQWEVSFSKTREEAEKALRELKPQIMLFDRDLAGPDWREFVKGFAAASGGACIMLVSKVVDEHLWNDLVSNGGYEVLRKPLREDELSRAVRMAWSYWSSAVKRPSSSI